MIPQIVISSYLLLLGVLASPIDIPSKQFLVKNLPGIDAIPEDERPLMYAGHLELNSTIEESYFFWKFIKPSSDFNRTIIWLNGGPGCSSMDGALMESGPLRVGDNEQLYMNKGSWHKVADIVFVDQPGGTGFSTTKDYDKDLNKVGDDFIVFLEKYFEVFPEDLNKELYIAGESYAGQYIPFIADKLYKSNKEFQKNLKGLLIGNGWIAPNIQSLSYIPYLLDVGILHQDDEFMPKLLKQQEHCQNLLNNAANQDKFSIIECENILTRILQYTRDKSAPKDQQCINMYDIGLKDSYPSCGMNWPPDLKYVQPYLQKDEVVESLNLNISKITKWRECDGDVSKFLTNKNIKPSFNLLPSLLEKVEIMLFNGGHDIICNNRGVLDLIDRLDWGGSKGFTQDTEEFVWKYDGDLTGTVKSSKNLTFVDVYNSSHMVPFDIPEKSRGVFDLFVRNFKIIDKDGASYIETPNHNKVSQLNEGEQSDEENAKGKSPIFFIIYLLFFVIIGGALMYFKKKKQPKQTSILRNKERNTNNNNNRNRGNKKTVSWADDSDIGPTEATTTPPPTYQRPRKQEERSSKLNNIINSFNRGGSNSGSYKKVETSDHFEDIELQSNLNRRDGDDHDEALEDYEFDIDNELENDHDLGTRQL